jgi:hypothetical protein
MRKPVAAHNIDANAGMCSRKRDHVQRLFSLNLSDLDVIFDNLETGCLVMINTLAY